MSASDRRAEVCSPPNPVVERTDGSQPKSVSPRHPNLPVSSHMSSRGGDGPTIGDGTKIRIRQKAASHAKERSTGHRNDRHALGRDTAEQGMTSLS